MDVERILLVERRLGVGDRLAGQLRGAGYEVIRAGTSSECLRQCDWQKPAVAIIGDSLHGQDWLALTAELRALHAGLGIILIASGNDDFEHVAGLNAGADSYFPAVAHPHVVLAQVRSLLRRHTPRPAPPVHEIQLGQYLVNLLMRQITDDQGREITPTPGEYALLAGLIKQRGVAVSRDELVASLRPMGDACALGDLRSVDVLIGRLRRKLDRHPDRAPLIQTVYGKGYRLVREDELGVAGAVCPALDH